MNHLTHFAQDALLTGDLQPGFVRGHADNGVVDKNYNLKKGSS